MSAKYFVLTRDLDGGAYTEYLHREPWRSGDTPVCATCGKYTGQTRWLPPYEAQVITYGAAFGDVVFGPATDLLMSEQLLRALTREALVDSSRFEPVDVTALRSASAGYPPSYFHFAPTYGPTAIDEDASAIRRHGSEICAACRLDGVEEVNGFILESQEGASIFIPRGLPGVVVVDEAAADVLRSGFLNVVLVETTQYQSE
jgi:hypothetical protein